MDGLMTGGRRDHNPAGWLGCAAGPLLWFSHQMLAAYLPGRCPHSGVRLLVSLPFILLLLAAAAWAGLEWRVYRQRTDQPEQQHTEEQHPIEQRARFVAQAGTMLPLIFLLIMLWQILAEFLSTGCGR